MCMIFRQINITHIWTFVPIDKFGHRSVTLAPSSASENIYVSSKKSIELVLCFFMISCFTSCTITVSKPQRFDVGKADTIFLVLSIKSTTRS